MRGSQGKTEGRDKVRRTPSSSAGVFCCGLAGGPTADLEEEAGVLEAPKPAALQGPQVPVASWAQQVHALQVHLQVR